MLRKPPTKREKILKEAAKRKRGVEITVIAERCDCSTSYVRLVLREAGYGPASKRRQTEPIWSPIS